MPSITADPKAQNCGPKKDVMSAEEVLFYIADPNVKVTPRRIHMFECGKLLRADYDKALAFCEAGQYREFREAAEKIHPIACALVRAARDASIPESSIDEVLSIARGTDEIAVRFWIAQQIMTEEQRKIVNEAFRA
jgi:hypothetical protein